jgi:hypothetical protein
MLHMGVQEVRQEEWGTFLPGHLHPLKGLPPQNGAVGHLVLLVVLFLLAIGMLIFFGKGMPNRNTLTLEQGPFVSGNLGRKEGAQGRAGPRVKPEWQKTVEEISLKLKVNNKAWEATQEKYESSSPATINPAPSHDSPVAQVHPDPSHPPL